MAISNFTEDMNIIAALSDTPNDTLTAAQLKAKFDEGGGKIKTYINGTVVPAVNLLLGLLSNNKIDPSQFADKSIPTGKIADGAITTAKLASSAVTTAKIADANVTTAKITDANVTTAKLANSAVTAAKLASNAVETAKIKNSNVTLAKVDFVKTTLDDTSDAQAPTSKAVASYISSLLKTHPVQVPIAQRQYVIASAYAADEAYQEALRRHILHLTLTNFSSLPVTFSQGPVPSPAPYYTLTSDHEVFAWSFSNPSAIVSDLGWETSSGKIKITGTLNGTTNIDLWLCKPYDQTLEDNPFSLG